MIRRPSIFSLQRTSNTKTVVVDNQNAVEEEQLFLSTHKDKIIALEELSLHDNAKDCWIAISDRIYNITDFLEEHPAGSDILLEYAGRDATVAFRAVGHSQLALGALETFFIGKLPAKERIYKHSDSRGLTDCQ